MSDPPEPRRLRAAVYDRYWHSMGGGERHAGMIAQVLSADGVEVDLLGHSDEVDRDELAARLGLDLSRCTMAVVADRGDQHLAEVSAQYDLFVNATYMSRLAPRSARAAYLCFFPTPPDHDLPRWRRAAATYIGPRLRDVAHPLSVDFGTGWFPPEGGRRRRWVWSSGEGVLAVAPGRDQVLQAEFGRPGGSGSVEVTVRDGDEVTLGRFEVGESFQRRRLRLPASADGYELHFASPTWVPSADDTRELGVAMSRMRLAASGLIGGGAGVRTRLAMRFPWLLQDSSDTRFLESYDVVLANSVYTHDWIERLWNSPSDVLFPPIDVADIPHFEQRRPTILSIGRFFAPGLGHAKRQLEMVQFFGDAVRRGQLTGWELAVVGGCETSQLPYLDEVRAAARGLPVSIHPNAPRPLVRDLISHSSIFWSATGLGEDENNSPWAQEHFGMTTAEAMAGGCVPIVIDKAGQREIVREGVDGFRWTTPAELVARTVQVSRDQSLRARLADSARERARQFSDEAFADRWRHIAVERSLLTPRATILRSENMSTFPRQTKTGPGAEGNRDTYIPMSHNT